MKESDLRKWMQRCWTRNGPPLAWVEPAFGSTIGLPDVFVPCELGIVPFELKLSLLHKSSGLFVAKVRPAQIRYHRMMASAGHETFFLTAHGVKKRFAIWMSRGILDLNVGRKNPGEVLLCYSDDKVKLKDLLVDGVACFRGMK